MFSQRTLWLGIALLALSTLACNAFAVEVEPGLTLPPPPTPNTQVTPPASQHPAGDGGLAPTATPRSGTGVATIDAPFSDPVVTALVNLNVRSGPGVQYDPVGFMLQDESARVLGVDPASGWWKIECPPRATSTECWVSGGKQYTAVGDAQELPATEVPLTPTNEAPPVRYY